MEFTLTAITQLPSLWGGRRAHSLKDGNKPKNKYKKRMSQQAVYSSRTYYGGSSTEENGSSATGQVEAFSGKGAVVGGVGATMSSGYSSGYSTMNGSTTKTVTTTSYSSSSSAKSSEVQGKAAVAIGSGTVITGHFDTRLLLDIRDREKLTIIGLNDRLADYIEKVRFLKIDNARLAQYLNALRAVRFQDVTVSATEEIDSVLNKQKETIDGVVREHDGLLRQARDLESQLQKLLNLPHGASEADINAALHAISAVEVQISETRRRILIEKDLIERDEKERAMLLARQKEMRRLIEEQRRLRAEAEKTLHVTKQVIKTIDIQHLIGVEELLAQSPWNSAEWEKFKAMLRAKIIAIRGKYEEIMEQSRRKHESAFTTQMDQLLVIRKKRAVLPGAKELRDEILRLLQELMTIEQAHFALTKQIEEVNFRLEDQRLGYGVIVSEKRSQITSYTDEINTLLRDMELLLKQKESLEAELKIYRQILESEEVRFGTVQSSHTVVAATRSTGDARASSIQRSAKGNISFKEVNAEGRYIVIENTHRSKVEDIGGWKLKRRIDGQREHIFVFPQGFELKPNRALTIYARGQGIASEDSLVFEKDTSFGVGADVRTYLYNREGEERATHSQKSSVKTAVLA